MTSSTTMITMIVIMLSINIALSSFQGAILDINPNAGVDFNLSNSPLNNYVVDGEIVVGSELLPENAPVEESTSYFSDIWNALKSWTQDKLQGLGFISNIFKQPYGFLRTLGLPESISYGVGILWYLVALLTMVSWWGGR